MKDVMSDQTPHLCNEHKEIITTLMADNCRECGIGEKNSTFKRCESCAVQQNKCSYCDAPIQDQPVFCQICVIGMSTCDVGSCSECGDFTSSGSYTFCIACAAKKQVCMACGNPPEEIAKRVADARAELTHIPYQACSNQQVMTLEECRESTQKFIASIQKEFPDVVITNTLWNLGIVSLGIPSTQVEQLVNTIQEKFNYTLYASGISISESGKVTQ